MRNKQHELQTQLSFEFSPNKFSLQIEIRNGEPIFAAKDVCDILNIENPSARVKERLDEDEYLTYVVRRAGQDREMLFVTESGLYQLIFVSRTPSARKFQKWVTSEVLPSIRKTGSYGLSKKVDMNHIDSVLPYVDQMEHEGKTVYAANHLFKLLGRNSGSHVMVRARELATEGKAFKLTGKDQEKWYIVREGIGRLLNVKARTAGDIAIIKKLKEGGML